MCGKHFSVEKWVNLYFENINPMSASKKKQNKTPAGLGEGGRKQARRQNDFVSITYLPAVLSLLLVGRKFV